MTWMLIRVNAEVSEEFSGAFPHLSAKRDESSTTLTGEITDMQELQGVLNLLSVLGLDVIELRTIPGE